MRRNAEIYRAVGHRFVTGFLAPEVLTVLHVLDRVQDVNGVRGSVAEVGVHHGKLFLGLHLLRRSGERSLAIDIFGDQELNVDLSGNGDEEKFRANVALWADDEGLVVHQGDSTQLDPETVRDLAGSDIRFFSVDGGHTAEIVQSDLTLAEATLVDGGVIIADDVFNQRWPGVAVGTMRYLDEGARLVPFAIGFNKVFLTQPQHSAGYREALVAELARHTRLDTTDSTFAGQPVTLLLRLGVPDLLRKSETARTVYHGAYRGMVRAMRKVTGKS
jgi:hypothetical protein